MFAIYQRLVRQSLSAFCSASFQYLSSGRRSHSLTETVYFTSLSFFRLISSFHNFSPDLVFYLFSFFCLHRGSPHDNSLIIPQIPERRQAISLSFFVLSVFFL